MKKIKYITAVVFLTIMLGSCSDSFFDINKDPNNPTEATPALVLPSAIANTAFNLGGYYHALGSYWSQQYAQAPAASQWSDWESYNLTEDHFNRQFTSMYSGGLYDYQYVRNSSAASRNWAYYSISTLMQAYSFQILADLYDKIPFTAALKGTAQLQPTYDNGTVVYDSLLARIDDAISKDFTVSSSVNPKTNDLVFGGSMSKWVQFGNTLKLKIYLRYVNVDAQKYKNQILALLSENNFLSEDAKFTSFKDEQTGYNPFYNTFVDRLSGNVVANLTLTNYLTNNSDPRLQKLFTASATGSVYKGMATGDGKNHPTETIKNYATPKITSTAPVYFFSKEEVLFLIAEAQARYTTDAEAQVTYKKAIDASLVSLGLTAGSVTYEPYNGVQSIIDQKWIAATNKNGLEAFFDFNRTGYPNIFSTSITSVLNGSEKPKRLFFPATERKSNANTPDKVALTVPVWWAK